ncbi:hypothetical protein BD413DRAFT_471784 [Trametes elegans]|nr:hypothetical protein BD413DRAFT_471784 [Trametes elegans]
MESFDAKGKERATDDALFLERLEMLYEQNLADLRAFAQREDKPFEEVRRRMSELHAGYLFDHSGLGASAIDRKECIQQALLDVSKQLETLELLGGLQSFFLVVDPNDPTDEGFLGGTPLGREFWRGHRGCGAAGAQAFKARCTRSAPSWPSHTPPIDPALLPASTPPASTTGSKGSARELKTELYAAMRDALRAASGVRTAEMKWTNHAKLDAYGVRLVGWPAGVPSQNPSTLSVAQNKLLLEMLGKGSIRFVRADGADQVGEAGEGPSERAEEDAIFEDSIDYGWACQEGAASRQHPNEAPGSRLSSATSPPPGPTTPKKRRVEEP